MGYYTDYEIDVLGDDNSGVDHKCEVQKTAGYSGLFEEGVKWYGHEKDMRQHSKLYPELVFKLSGEGEEAGDLWVEYHQNGKMQKCKARIEYDVFDAGKLE